MTYTVTRRKFIDVLVHFIRLFTNEINNDHPNIDFTVKWTKTSINFLQVTVYMTEGNVKPTDSQQYLVSSSRHPFL